MNKTNIIKNILAAMVITVFGVSFARAEVISEWHQEAVRLTILPASALSPVRQNRAMAIVQVSVHDAVNGITGEHQTYLSRLPAPAGATPQAAAIAASHHALTTLFPSQTMPLYTMYLNSLMANGISMSDPGLAYGVACATRILTARSTDGASTAQIPYLPPNAGMPGVYMPLTGQTPLLPGWGNVTPWVLRSGDQFRPEPTTPLTSEEYARDYNEIKEIGSLTSTTRTPLQTQIATFWLGSPVAIWSQPLAQLNAASNFSISKRARIFGLVYMAVSDAGVACWDAKYYYNFWRPQPAIRRGNEDGNDATVQDAAWTPLHPTPPHPDYPSGHTTASTAMATIMQLFYGDEPGQPISSTLPQPMPNPPITRQWNTFEEGLDEVIDARVFSGIHFRTADVVGSRVGGQVARFVYTHALRVCKGNGARCS